MSRKNVIGEEMAEIDFVGKNDIEQYLQMQNGYVLDFSNETFKKFFASMVDVNIYDEKYAVKGTSKANRLRTFLEIHSCKEVAELLGHLVDYHQPDDKIKKIIDRLKTNKASNQIDKITPNNDETDFKLLCENIKETINENKPELALDRLHTFYMKSIRELCKKHVIEFSETDSLNAIFGKYVKFIEGKFSFEAEMTKTIMKCSISILEKFNDVRNNKSLAHDNKLLNHDESLYIFDTLARLKGFIDNIENTIQ